MNPFVVRNMVLPAHELVFGRRTFGCFRELKAWQWLPADRLREHQLRRLRELVGMAMTQTRAYRDLAGLDAAWLPETLEDLRRLPLLDKTTISAHRDDLVNRDVPGGAIRYTTGGSSGQPLIFYFDKRRQAVDKACRMLTHEWWGVRPGDREAYVWGSPVELSKQDRLKQFRDWLTNDMLLPAFDLSEQSIAPFVERLRRFGPRCIFGYPSSIALLCQLARRKGLRLDDCPVKAVFCTAEVLYDHQKAIIAEAFGGAPVVNGYGSREGGFISHECPAGRMHIMSANIIVEFLQDGRPVSEGQDGEIVVTNLDNHAMPFIRYRTGDIGQPSSEVCPCGRVFETMKVVKGRSTDFIVTPDGRWVHGLGLIYVIREVPGIEQYQIIQEDVDSIRVLLVLGGSFPSDGEARIRAGLEKRLGTDMRVVVERMERLEHDPSGKFRYVISKVARERQARLG